MVNQESCATIQRPYRVRLPWYYRLRMRVRREVAGVIGRDGSKANVWILAGLSDGRLFPANHLLHSTPESAPATKCPPATATTTKICTEEITAVDLGIAETVVKSGATKIACTINGKTAAPVEEVENGTADRIMSLQYLTGTVEGHQIWIEGQEMIGLRESPEDHGPALTIHHCHFHRATATYIENHLPQETEQTDHPSLMVRHMVHQWTGKRLHGAAGW